MRIIAGKLKGRRLATPAWDGLRPTSDKLRETLFNVLAGKIPGARVLDGFAGTGALGIEAWSRGAAEVTFVESDRRATALIEENLKRCGIADGCVIIRDSVVRALDGMPSRFDVMLLDPPYGSRRGPAAVDFDALLNAAGRVLADEGIVVLEHAKKQAAPAAAGSLVSIRDVVSGDSALSLYVNNPNK